MASARKPDPMVFKLAFAKTGSAAASSIMIGDDLDTDISGARGVGMDQVYFNPARKEHREDITFEIENLKELMVIL
jgi:putative hydrolase of the HAD superfamily